MNKAKSLAQELGISEAAARKRLQRKVDIQAEESGQVDIVEEKVDNGAPYYKALVPDSRFEGAGRGCVRGGMVLVSQGIGKDDIMVSEAHWRARLDYRCPHKLYGWACKCCL